MSKQLKLDEFKQQVADLYSQRSSNYDKGIWNDITTFFVLGRKG
jgi:hypothetical protein